MITELVIAAGLTYAYKYINNSENRKLKNDFAEIMQKTGIKNKEEETFQIYKIVNTSYGYIAYIDIPKGLSKEHLDDKLNIIQDNLNSLIELEKDKFKDYIKAYIINKDISKYKFEPVEAGPNLLLIGKDYKTQNYFLDVNKDAHILIGGATGTGKTFLLAAILTNLIYNSAKFIDIYLLQIMKSELSAFNCCECVKDIANDEAKCTILLNFLLEEIDNRSRKFEKYGVRNITQWNKHFKNKYMKRIYVVIEELSFFMNAPLPLEKITDIAKAGRSVGVHILSCIQRTTATNMPPDLKSQMTRITFRQKSSIDSTNIINTSDAVSLKERECIVDGNSDYRQVKAPWIDEDYVLLHKYVPDIKIPTQEEKQEVLNVKKIRDKIYSIEQPKVIEVQEKDIKEVKPRKTKKFVGRVSLEEWKDDDQ